MIRDLKQCLSSGAVLIADGATGTALMAAGLRADVAAELWNVERPDVVTGLHRAYLEAGSQIILTNTFGGSGIRLQKRGVLGRTRELNRAGARLAREAAGEAACVAGDIGPTGEMMQPFGTLTPEVAEEAFAEQAAALAEGGADAIWIETMTDLQEARAAVLGARQATALPILCSLSFGKTGRTMMGVSAQQAAQVLWPLGLTAIGANCGEGLQAVEAVLQAMHAALPGAPLIAKPNAGLPRVEDGQTVYDMTPEDLAARVVDLIAVGARILGACCGSGPAHIQVIARAVQARGGPPQAQPNPRPRT